MTSELVPVPVGACRCPGAPHPDGDVVLLYPELPMTTGTRAHAAMSVLEDGVERLAKVYEILTEGCIADWTFLDDEGEKVAITPATIRGALAWGRGGQSVALKATEMHGTMLLAPFIRPSRAEKTPTPISSRTGQTAKPSTSPRRSSKPSANGRSAQSSDASSAAT